MILLPASAPKESFDGDVANVLQTKIFWSSPEFGAAELKNGALTRTVRVTVFALREAGE